MIPAPPGLLFAVYVNRPGRYTPKSPVIAFDNEGDALVVNEDTGQLCKANSESNNFDRIEIAGEYA